MPAHEILVIVSSTSNKGSGEPHEILVIVSSSSNKGSGESAQMRRLARAFAACMRKILILMKTQAKVYTSSLAGYVSMGVKWRLFCTSDKYKISSRVCPCDFHALWQYLRVCMIWTKLVSMIRKNHNHKLHTNPWHRVEEPQNNHETPGRHNKQSNQLSLPHH